MAGVRLSRSFKLACVGLFLLAGLEFQSDSCYAQVSSASINGTIRDSTSAVIPDATVLLRNTRTAIETRSTTNSQGIYVILNILPGNYTLEASKEGFSSSKLEAFNVVVNQGSIFDFQLAVGKVQDSVTVEAVGAQVQSATAELGGVLVQQQVVDLPVGRSIQNLMRLNPGVNAITTGQSSIPSVNGQINRSSMYMLDGVNNQGTFYAALGFSPIMEMVEEFKVQSHNDSAEFGGVMGGVINTATKSGTNDLHGEAWELAQNEAFNARNTFQASVAPFKQHIFGGTAGGPVTIPKLYKGRNRTFFFAGYQDLMSTSPALSYFRVPTDANYNGDFSDWPKQIYNPFTTRANPAQAGTFIRDPFPGNQVPVSLMNKGTVYLAKTVLPKPVFIGIGDFNAVNATPNNNRTQTFSTRLDHKISDMDSLSFRYSGNYQHNLQAGSLPVIGRNADARSHNVAGTWVHTFGSTAVLQAQVGRVVQWSSTLDKYTSLPSDFASQVGFSSNILTPYVDGGSYLPSLSPSGFFSTGEQWAFSQTGDSWQGKLGFSKLLGTHMFKVGGEWNRVGWGYVNGVTTASFQNAQTADPLNLGNTGSSLASYFLNVPDSATRRDIIETTPFYGGVIGFYFQDSWKATSNLTINLGLRYDRTFIPTSGTDDMNNNRVGDMDLITGTYILQKSAPLCASAGKSPCVPAPAGSAEGYLPANVVVSPTGKVFTDTTKNFQPRLGFAYRMGAKTAIRGAVGVFFDNYSGITQISRNFAGTWPSLGFQSAVNLNYPTTAQPTPSIFGSNPLPSAVFPAANPFTQSAYWADPNWKNAYSTQWNIGVQRQLTSTLLMTVNYVGSESHRTDIGGRYNVGTTAGSGDRLTRTPFPYIAVPSSFDRSWGNANYHALQTQFERRWAVGLAFTAAYTWSKAIDPGSSGFFGVEGNSIQNPYQMAPDRSVASYDVPHNLVLSWVYDLPFGKSKALHSGNQVVDYVLGNWQINGIADIRAGQPVNVTVSGDIANTGNVGYMRPNVVGDWHASSPTVSAWFNTAAFASPAAFTFGNAGRNILRSDGVHRFDMSLFRSFSLHERFRVQLRAEAYNIFNTVTYNAPTTEFTNVNFGKVTGAMAARSMQIGAKIYF